MPDKTLQLSPMTLGVVFIGMAGFWGFAMMFFVSTMAMINDGLPLDEQRQEYYRKIFDGWGIVCYPLVNLFFVFCLAEAVHLLAVQSTVSKQTLCWLIGAAVVVGLVYCVGVLWVFLPK